MGPVSSNHGHNMAEGIRLGDCAINVGNDYRNVVLPVVHVTSDGSLVNGKRHRVGARLEVQRFELGGCETECFGIVAGVGVGRRRFGHGLANNWVIGREWRSCWWGSETADGMGGRHIL